eukprot:6518844-Lingulodinium_polyedra.AAC.1
MAPVGARAQRAGAATATLQPAEPTIPLGDSPACGSTRRGAAREPAALCNQTGGPRSNASGSRSMGRCRLAHGA